MMRRSLILFGLFFVLASCKTAPVVPAAGSMPSGGSFEGVWYSSQFEQMYLRRSGDTVRGIYTYKYGGTLEGKITGDLLVFDWVDPGDSSEARRTFKGKGYLKMRADDELGYVLEGRWGYEDDRHGGGPWEAQYIRELDESDPRDIEDFRSRTVR